MRFSPGGYNQRYPSEPVECEAAGGGRFELPGFRGLHAVVGMGMAAWAPGYEVGWYEDGMEGETANAEAAGTVRAQLDSERLTVEIRLRRLEGVDPEQWERHLHRIEVGTQYSYPLPKDLLLDEAYRYVSEGGELTEGMLDVIWKICARGYRGNRRWSDRRRLTLSQALLEYCDDHPSSERCARMPGTLQEIRDFFAGEGGDRK